MVDPNTRQGKRTPVTLKIKFKSETLEQFIERYAVDVSQGGIFIRTKEPLAVGTQMKFEFQLRDASPLIGGEGTVVWTRENDPSRPAIAPGMGVRFDRLADGSQSVLERILAEKVKQAPQRPPAETTKPPMFTDTPTRVAPPPVQDALLGNEPRRRRADSYNDQHTPLPKPMPFHSDADEFPEEAFEEATKVRALDELIAATAEAEGVGAKQLGQDLAAARRQRTDATLAEPPTAAADRAAPRTVEVERESAPVLPSPPERAQPRLLDTSPSPRAVEAHHSGPVMGSLGAEGAKTRLGLEPARAIPASTPPPAGPSIRDLPTRPSGMRAVASETTGPARMPDAKKSNAGILVLLLLLVAAGGAAVWWFVIRPRAQKAADEQAQGSGSAGSAVVPPDLGSGSSGSGGSAGSGVAMVGSGSAGSAAVPPPPKAELVESVIGSNIEKSTVEILNTEQRGPAPFTAKLEKGTAYKARVSALGYLPQDIDVTGGEAKASAKLVAKPRVISVTSDPPGALIFVDGAPAGHSTPFDVELTKAQAAKKTVRVQLRKGGFRVVDKVVDAAAYIENDDQLVAKLDAKLAVAPVAPVQVPTHEGSGSAAVPLHPNPDGAGSGSATPEGGPVTSPGGGSATPPAGSGSAAPTPTPTPVPEAKAGSAAEPEPDFTKKP